MHASAACGAVEGQEELSLRSDELSIWGKVPAAGEGCSGTEVSVGVREEVSGWLFTVEVAQG